MFNAKLRFCSTQTIRGLLLAHPDDLRFVLLIFSFSKDALNWLNVKSDIYNDT